MVLISLLTEIARTSAKVGKVPPVEQFNLQIDNLVGHTPLLKEVATVETRTRARVSVTVCRGAPACRCVGVRHVAQARGS